MSNEQAILLGFYFPMGMVILSLGAFMYDSLQKTIPKEDLNSSIFAGHKKLIKVFYITPIIYLVKSVKSRNIKGVLVAGSFFSLLVIAFVLGYCFYLV